MSRETLILVGFCVFAFLVGIRLKRYFGAKRVAGEGGRPMNKNQRSKMAKEGEEPRRYSRSKRKKTIRLFTVLALVSMLGLFVYMIPALVRDVQRVGSVDATNLVLRMIVVGLAILIFVTGYMKLVRERKGEETVEGGEQAKWERKKRGGRRTK